MQNNDEEFLKNKDNNLRLVRTEIMFTPILVFLPIIVAGLLINNWYFSGFSKGVSGYEGELMLAIIILVFNIIFDIPFIRTLIQFNKKLLFNKS
jgi:ABC-type phosphate transport system permease subunit